MGFAFRARLDLGFWIQRVVTSISRYLPRLGTNSGWPIIQTGVSTSTTRALYGNSKPSSQLPDGPSIHSHSRFDVGCGAALHNKHGAAELPQGTLDLLILRILALEPVHGWAVSERIQQISGDLLRVQQGSLYPALHRLERRGWIKARWGASENNRRAKFYELTKAGRRQLEIERDAWEKLTAVVSHILEMA